MKIHSRFVIVIIALYLSAFHPACADNECGPRSLHLLVNMMGKQISYEEILEITPLSEKGCSIYDLIMTSNNIGYESLAVKMDLDSFMQYKYPAILFLNDNHFAVVDPRIRIPAKNDVYFRIHDYPNPPSWITRSKLSKDWNGNAIIPRHLEHITQHDMNVFPELSLDSYLYDLGNINSDEELHISIPIRNTGLSALEILDVKKSCGCTKAEISNPIINSSEESMIQVTFDARGKRGFQAITITLISNDVLHPEHVITLCAFVKSKMAITPAVLHVEQAKPQVQLKNNITIESGDGLPFEVIDWELICSDSPNSLANISTPTLTFITATTEKVTYELSLNIDTANTTIKDADYELIMKTDHPQLGKISIPVSFEAEVGRNMTEVNFGIVRSKLKYSQSLILDKPITSDDFIVNIDNTSKSSAHDAAMPTVKYDQSSRVLTLALEPKDFQGPYADYVCGSVEYKTKGDEIVSISWKYLNVM